MAALDQGVDDTTIYPIIEAIASHTGAPPTDLPPLAGAVDPDALTKILDHADSGTVEVRFDYWGHHVTVDSDGSVRVESTT